MMGQELYRGLEIWAQRLATHRVKKVELEGRMGAV